MVETAATCLAILGAFLVTSPHRKVRLAAFLLWVVSNTTLTVVFASEARWALVVMYVFFLVAALLGVWGHRK